MEVKYFEAGGALPTNEEMMVMREMSEWYESYVTTPMGRVVKYKDYIMETTARREINARLKEASNKTIKKIKKLKRKAKKDK